MLLARRDAKSPEHSARPTNKDLTGKAVADRLATQAKPKEDTMSNYAKVLLAEMNLMNLAKIAPTKAARDFWYRKALDVRS